MALFSLRQQRKTCGLLWTGPDSQWSANFVEGLARPAKAAGSIIAAVLRRSDENPVGEWAATRSLAVERIVFLQELLTSVLERFVSERSALVAGAIGNTHFLGLFKDGECIFEHSLDDGPAEFEKALKACLRQARGATSAYLICDSGESRDQLQTILLKATGSAPKILAHGNDAGELLAAAVAPKIHVARSRFSMAATVAGFLILLGVFFGDHVVGRRVAELERQRTELQARKTSLITKAIALELELDGHPTPVPRSETSNVDDTLELLAFLSKNLPPEVSLEEVAAVESVPSSGYQGLKTSSDPSSSPRFLVRGSAKNITSFSRVLDGFEKGEWRIENVEEIHEGRSDTAPVGYGFQLSVRRS